MTTKLKKIAMQAARKAAIETYKSIMKLAAGEQHVEISLGSKEMVDYIRNALISTQQAVQKRYGPPVNTGRGNMSYPLLEEYKNPKYGYTKPYPDDPAADPFYPFGAGVTSTASVWSVRDQNGSYKISNPPEGSDPKDKNAITIEIRANVKRPDVFIGILGVEALKDRAANMASQQSKIPAADLRRIITVNLNGKQIG